MAELVKWLTLRIVAPACVGSTPTFRPICLLSPYLRGFYIHSFILRNNYVTFPPFFFNNSFIIFQYYIHKFNKKWLRLCYNGYSLEVCFMDEKQWGSSVNEYEEIYQPSNYIKQLQWDMAIGLQQVDNLKPSKYLKQISEKNILGELTIKEVEQSLREYYTMKEKQKDINHIELECDFVSMRIVELLNQDDFELSVDYLKYIHKYLLQDV